MKVLVAGRPSTPAAFTPALGPALVRGHLAWPVREIAAALNSEVLATRDTGAQILLHGAATDRFAKKRLDRGMDLDHAGGLLAKVHDCSHGLSDLARSFRQWPFMLLVRLPEKVGDHVAEPF
ncbi:MAG TPA: hypothetical protein VMU72_10265 [Gaiellaceae bacterium]|nr:hypothetical protein [Gaiellaceae bacterium]HVC86979.1 hypothetical protein [Gaiellaceae bacterium]